MNEQKEETQMNDFRYRVGGLFFDSFTEAKAFAVDRSVGRFVFVPVYRVGGGVTYGMGLREDEDVEVACACEGALIA